MEIRGNPMKAKCSNFNVKLYKCYLRIYSGKVSSRVINYVVSNSWTIDLIFHVVVVFSYCRHNCGAEWFSFLILNGLVVLRLWVLWNNGCGLYKAILLLLEPGLLQKLFTAVNFFVLFFFFSYPAGVLLVQLALTATGWRYSIRQIMFPQIWVISLTFSYNLA